MRKFTGIEYLMIDISNNWGNDKLTWEERFNWFEDNQMCLDSVADEADNPILYRKAVRAYRKALKGEPTNHPVSLDATWSGGQLMAVLLRCEKTARACNLINTGKRADIYTTVKNVMNNKFSMDNSRQDIKDCLMP